MHTKTYTINFSYSQVWITVAPNDFGIDTTYIFNHFGTPDILSIENQLLFTSATNSSFVFRPESSMVSDLSKKLTFPSHSS